MELITKVKFLWRFDSSGLHYFWSYRLKDGYRLVTPEVRDRDPLRPLNWQLSTIYQLYQLILFTKVYRKNDKIWKNWLTDWKLIVIFTTLKLIARSQQEKLKIFEKMKNFNFYPWQNQNNFLYLIRQNKMPLSRRLAENWKNGSFWKVLVINRTYWLQDQSCPSGAIGSAADS